MTAEADLSFVRERKRAFLLAFGSPAGKMVLEELAPFCRATTSCYAPDPRDHALAEGRREVWLRIQRYLTETPEELLALYRRRPVPTTGDDE